MLRDELTTAALFAAVVLGFCALMQSQVDAARDDAELARAALAAVEGVCRAE